MHNSAITVPGEAMGVMDRDWYQEHFLRKVLGVTTPPKPAPQVVAAAAEKRRGWWKLLFVSLLVVGPTIGLIFVLRGYR